MLSQLSYAPIVLTHRRSRRHKIYYIKNPVLSIPKMDILRILHFLCNAGLAPRGENAQCLGWGERRVRSLIMGRGVWKESVRRSAEHGKEVQGSQTPVPQNFCSQGIDKPRLRWYNTSR